MNHPVPDRPPVPGYDELSAEEAGSALRGLPETDLERALAYERRHARRPVVVERIADLLAGLDAAGRLPAGADPDPARWDAGLEPGGSVPPGETPPAEGSTPDAGPRDTHNPPRGWGAAPLTVIVLVAAVFVVFFISYAVLL